MHFMETQDGQEFVNCLYDIFAPCHTSNFTPKLMCNYFQNSRKDLGFLVVGKQKVSHIRRHNIDFGFTIIINMHGWKQG